MSDTSKDAPKSHGTSAGSTVGAGFGVICLALAIIMLYRGCGDKGSLLPPIFPSEQTSKANPIDSL